MIEEQGSDGISDIPGSIVKSDEKHKILDVTDRDTDKGEHLLPAHFMPEGRQCYDWIKENIESKDEISDQRSTRRERLYSDDFIPDATFAGKSVQAKSTITYTTADLSSVADAQNVQLHNFLKAAEEGDLTTLHQLLKNSRTLLNAKDRDGYTATHRACYSGHEHALQFLIEKGCNIRSRTEDGWEPLHCAVRWNHVNICKILLKNGASVNAKTNGCQTPLHLAAVSPDQVAILEMLLLNPDIDGTIKNGAGDTAEDIAFRSGPHVKLFEMLDSSLTI